MANIEQENTAVEEIFIEPLDAAVNSDEYSADGADAGLIDNINGAQLTAGPKVFYAASKE